MKSTFAVAVLSFDKYCDLWDTFFECFNKFWQSEYPIYLVTNNLQPRYKGISVITTGPEISWSHRARTAMQKIDAEYILIMLEDYYLTSIVNDSAIMDMVNFMIETKADYLRIYPFPKLKFEDSGKNGIHKLPLDSLYGVNLQPSIWKKEFLTKTLEEGDFSAWEFEARQKNGVSTQCPGTLYVVDYAPFTMVNGVLQGKWYTPSVQELSKLGISVDTSKRDVLERKKVLIYNAKIAVRKLLGPKVIRKIKPYLKKLGIKFVTE